MSKTVPPSPLRRLLLFAGSVKMTVVLLVLGVLVMAAGTILESRSDAAVAQAAVYRTFWFDFFLVLIVVNLAAAVLNRLPLKRHQLSFAVTHASIIVLMFGAWMSRQYGYEGMLFVTEGGESATLVLSGKEIVLTGPAPGEEPGDHLHVLEEYRLPETVYLDGFVLRERGGAGQPGIQIAEFVHDGFREVGVASSDEEWAGPGIEFTVSGMGESLDGWLLANQMDSRRNDIGPFVIEMLQMRDTDAMERRRDARTARAEVVVERGGDREPLRIAMPDGMAAPLDFGGGVSVAVIQYAEHARVVDGNLTDDPASPRNPAAVVEIKSASSEERHIVFSEFPDFAVHQVGEAGPLTAGVALESSGTSGEPLFTILIGPGGKIYHQFSTAEGRNEAVEMPVDGIAVVGETPFQFEIRRYLPRADRQESVRPAETGEEGGYSLARIEIDNGETQQSFWLEQGQSLAVPALGLGRQLAMRRQTRSLPLKVSLDAFDVAYYAGSRRPSDYSSQVRVSSVDGHTPMVSTTISMNRPLDYAGFRLFQSSYSLGQGGGPDTTILSVSRDPGVPIVYGAFVFLILGVGWYVLGDGRGKRHAPRTPAAHERDILLVPDPRPEAGPESATASPDSPTPDPSLSR